MKVHALIVAAAAVAFGSLIACSSSSSGGSGSIPTCKGGTTMTSGMGSPACNSCVESSCGSQVSAAESACSDYFSCYSACDCSNGQCILNCTSKLQESACQNSFGSLDSCLMNNCNSQCLSGGGTPDGG